jgi:two-component system sensor histidine kinase YesM
MKSVLMCEIRSRLRSLSIRVLLMYFVATVLPFTLVEFITYKHWVKSELETAIIENQRVLSESTTTLENQTARVSDIYSQLNIDDRLEGQFMRLNEVQVVNPADMLELIRFFTVVKDMQFNGEYGFMHLSYFDMSGRAAYSNSFYPYGTNQGEEDWFIRTKEAGGNCVIQWPHKPTGVALGYQNTDVISFSQQINGPLSKEPMGVILLSYNPAQFYRICRYLIFSSDSIMMLQSKDGELIFDTRDDYKRESEQRIFFNDELLNRIQKEESGANFTVEHRGEKWVCVLGKKSSMGWQLISMVPFTVLTRHASRYINTFNTLALLVLFLCVSITVLFINKDTRQIAIIAAYMQDAEKNNFKTRIAPSGKTREIELLSTSFNHMSDRIEAYIEKERADAMQKTVLELQTMEAQINPHFLGNTLEIIRWKAVKQGNEEVAEYIYLMSTYFKDVLSDMRLDIMVEEEFRHLENYIKLSRQTLSGGFMAEIFVDEKLAGYRIKKMMLQPFVENAILHGLKNKEGERKLKISANIVEHTVIQFTVYDNGNGFVGRKEYRLTVVPGKPDCEKDFSLLGTGIRNTIRRLELYYGEDWKLQIHSIRNIGTEVVLTIQNKIIEESED